MLDPVMVSTTGYSLLADDEAGAARAVVRGDSDRDVHEVELTAAAWFAEGGGLAGAAAQGVRRRCQRRASAEEGGRPARDPQGAEACRASGSDETPRHRVHVSAAIATQLARARRCWRRLSCQAYVTEAIRGGLPIGHGQVRGPFLLPAARRLRGVGAAVRPSRRANGGRMEAVRSGGR
jgi:hypothetical protein